MAKKKQFRLPRGSLALEFLKPWQIEIAHRLSEQLRKQKKDRVMQYTAIEKEMNDKLATWEEEQPTRVEKIDGHDCMTAA